MRVMTRVTVRARVSVRDKTEIRKRHVAAVVHLPWHVKDKVMACKQCNQ